MPPPRTMSSGSSAAIRRATTSATCRRHFFLPRRSSPRPPDVVLVGALLVGQVAELHRLDDAVDDHAPIRGRFPGRGRASCRPCSCPSACMAASLTTFTGRPKAAAKSNPTQPRPRLCGSATGRPRRTGPGIADRHHVIRPSAASFLTPETIRLGVSVGPDGNDRRSCCPLARILTEVPPTSTTSTFLTEDFLRPRIEAVAQSCA